MNKITTIASVLLLTVIQAFAQKEFKVAKHGGKLAINNVSNLNVEGYEGKEIIFSVTSKEENTNDPRAAGLSALSNIGFDNTGIGISVTEKENLIIVSPIERDLALKVKLPKGVALSFKTTGFSTGDSTVITLSNIQSEIDASTQYENISLKNVTGPISIKTLYGNIEGKLTPSFKGPISLVSVYGFIDVTVPENIKADMSINTQYETLYAAKDLKLVVDEAPVKVNSAYAYGQAAALSKAEGQDAHSVTIGNTSSVKVKGNGVVTVTTDNVPVPSAPPAVAIAKAAAVSDKDKANQDKKKITTVISDLSYTYTSDFPMYFNAGKGTVVNGKLNGGGEKIILKSTYGKIYLRK